MNAAAVTLALLNLVVIGLLPRIFFRRDGRLNARWWLTASPFFAAGGVVVAGAAGSLAPAVTSFVTAREVAAAALHLASVGLIALTIGSHRVPLALWHQDEDAPVELVTWGPYRLVRHPFYAAFLLCLAGCAVTLPHLALFVLLAYAVVALEVTARREERRLLGSQFGDAYAAYMKVTGRLVPVVGRAA